MREFDVDGARPRLCCMADTIAEVRFAGARHFLISRIVESQCQDCHAGFAEEELHFRALASISAISDSDSFHVQLSGHLSPDLLQILVPSSRVIYLHQPAWYQIVLHETPNSPEDLKPFEYAEASLRRLTS